MRYLFAWDIDGTLLSTGGAGRSALNRSFFEIFGVVGAFDEVVFHGRTDKGIVAEAFRLAGLKGGPDMAEALKSRYLPCLDENLKSAKHIMTHFPGVQKNLNVAREVGHMGVLTGNWEGGARRKLGAARYDFEFVVGAFGEDSADRDDLVPILCERARQAGLEFDEVVVVGDTPADIVCARAGGALAVAVATGGNSFEELQSAKPDLLLRDMATGEFENWLRTR
jgi:phosphoglycolate phosphatase